MHLIKYLNIISSHIYVYFLKVVLCHTIDLIVLEDAISKHLAQARIDPVLLQQKAYLYYEELQILHRKIKYNDSKAIYQVKQIINKGGQLYFNHSINTNSLKDNDWSSFELSVLNDIISATKQVLNKCITSIAHLNNTYNNNLNNHTRTSLEYDSYKLRSEQEEKTQSEYENTDVSAETLSYNRFPKEEETNIENLLYKMVNKKYSDEFNNETFKITMPYWKNGKKLFLDGEKLRQVNIEKFKRRIKHEEMKTIANIKKTEKQRKHLERMKQRQMMKERKEKRMEKHRLLMKTLEKQKRVNK